MIKDVEFIWMPKQKQHRLMDAVQNKFNATIALMIYTGRGMDAKPDKFFGLIFTQ